MCVRVHAYRVRSCVRARVRTSAWLCACACVSGPLLSDAQQLFACFVVSILARPCRSLALALTVPSTWPSQQLLVGFKERVRVFNVLHKEMKMYREIPITKCRELQVSSTLFRTRTQTQARSAPEPDDQEVEPELSDLVLLSPP